MYTKMTDAQPDLPKLPNPICYKWTCKLTQASWGVIGCAALYFGGKLAQKYTSPLEVDIHAKFVTNIVLGCEFANAAFVAASVGHTIIEGVAYGFKSWRQTDLSMGGRTFLQVCKDSCTQLGRPKGLIVNTLLSAALTPLPLSCVTKEEYDIS